ncbi:MAG: radical SAM protein [Clostridia bacterium]|nr:radical SAM protein [Clostridia bacterium]MDH7572906.1 radical SAM protein [Clostridia bacterium]
MATERLRACNICPHACGVNRLAGETGKCRAGARAAVADYGPHFGEEAVLVGRHGSGTVFFGHCNLRCVFCQNWEISHGGAGRVVSEEELAGVLLDLQDMGCHNLNLVTPTHFVPQILGALAIGLERGLSLPLVYNCGGYEAVETLVLLDGVVDIYMPDFKYWNEEPAARYSGAPDYPERAREALKEMHRQVGDLVVGPDGLAVRGLLVRHLVLPDNLAGTEQILRFIAGELSRHTFVNIMAQYYPAHKAGRYPPLDRRLTREEYAAALAAAREAGLTRAGRW